MLQMTIRHKSIEIFIWLLCFLTFYLGFNHQVMCYELLPGGGVHKVHLQFIECNPLAAYIPANASQADKYLPLVLSARQTANDCPVCRDFHLSFKKSPGFDSLSLSSMATHLSVEFSLIFNGLLSSLNSRAATYLPGGTQACDTQGNTSLTLLKTIILLI